MPDRPGLGGPNRYETTIESDLRKIRKFFVLVTVVVSASILSWALSSGSPVVAFGTFGLCLSIAGGAALVGGFVGLLFGIPKSISDPATVLNPAPPDAGEEKKETAAGQEGAATLRRSDLPARARYAANSNLEQVSDWLTKIIIGVGLVQISELAGGFRSLATFLASGFPTGLRPDPAVAGGVSQAEVVAACLVVYGCMSGFLGGYLLTRMYLPGAFDRAEEAEERARQLEAQAMVLAQEARRREAAEQERREQERRETEELRALEGEIIEHIDLYGKQGFQRVIDVANEILNREGQRTNPRPWFYLACAYGQAYRWQEEHPLTDAEQQKQRLDQLRQQALQAVRSTLFHGTATSSWKHSLRLVWDPNFPDKPKEENDLEVFYSQDSRDPFYALLG